ncbi:MAG: efflux RND transporter periplasmic adaptor subunit [Deltaproteobacteria bacterium]|nr:efflux RND transporter periplasmic adaptor subunit [Deltaproteobacteria bacterium]
MNFLSLLKGRESKIKRFGVLAILALGAYWGVSLAFFPKEVPVSYLTDFVKPGQIVKTVVTVGEVTSPQLVNVGAQVSGKIEKLYVEAGDEVVEGQLVAEIDSTTQRNTLESERARLKTYEAQLVSKEIALKTAQSKYERELKLKRSDATSTENLEAAEQSLAAAKASLEETKSNILQSSTSVNTAETNLAYTRITSPLDGTVVSVPVRQGQTVNANQTTPTIVQIADLRFMEIKMEISEGDVTKVKPGLPVTYTILSEPDRFFTGVLESVDPGLTSVSNGSYSGASDSSSAVYYYGKLKADNADGVLRIGMTTQNAITVAEAKDVLIVPTVALSNIVTAKRSAEQTGDLRGSLDGSGPRRGGRGERRGEGGPRGRRAFNGDNRPDPERRRGQGEGGRGRGSRQDRSESQNSAAARSAAAAADLATQLSSLQPGQSLAQTLVIKNGQAEVRDIVIGISDNMNTEVVSGLADGEEVVVAQMTGAEMEKNLADQSSNMRNRQRRGPGGGMPRF